MVTEKTIKTWKYHIDQGLRDLFNLVRRVNDETPYGVFFVVLPEGHVSASLYADKKWISDFAKPAIIKDSLYAVKPDETWDEIEFNKAKLWLNRMQDQLYRCLERSNGDSIRAEAQ